MLRLSLINPADISNPYGVVKPIPLPTSGISELKFTGDINSAYQLDLKINTNLDFAYRFLLEDRDHGLRIDTEDFSIAFIQERGSSYKRAGGGTTSFKFYSTLLDLKTSEPIVQPTQTQDPVYSGSAQSFVSSIDPNFNFLFISPDKDVNYQIPAFDNFDLLLDFLGQNGWEMRENGLVNIAGVEKPQILVGDVRQIKNYYSSTNQNKYKTYIANNYHSLDNPFDPEALIIKNVEEFARGDVYTHCYAIIQGGVGSSQNARVEFTDPTASYISSEYPLETINGKQYVRNTKVNRQKNRYYQYSVSLATNIEDPDSTDFEPIPDEKIQQIAYNKVISFLRAKTEEMYYKYDISFKKFILPGNTIEIDYRETVDNFNEKTNVFNLKDSFILRNVEYDLGQFVKR